MDQLKLYMCIHVYFMEMNVDFDELYDRKAEIWILLDNFIVTVHTFSL